jgi:hypothetical protein
MVAQSQTPDVPIDLSAVDESRWTGAVNRNGGGPSDTLYS